MGQITEVTEPTPMTRHYGQSLPPHECDRHRAEIAVEVEAILDGYWQQRPSDPVKVRILANWMDALEAFEIAEVRLGLRQWVEHNPRRKPNFGDVLAIVRANRWQGCQPAWAAMRDICERHAESAGVPTWMLRGKTQDRETCRVRAACFADAKRLGIPLTLIGEFFGGRDHTTIISALRNHGHEGDTV